MLGLGSDKQLLEELNEGSQTLKTVVHNFVMWLGKYSAELHQFYETKLTNYGARFGTRWNEMASSFKHADDAVLTSHRSSPRRAPALWGILEYR